MRDWMMHRGTLRYGNRTIFTNATLSLQAGERLGLYGPSGCGKSSLARCLSGRENLTTGHVYFQGCLLKTLKKKPIGWIDQFPRASLNPYWRIDTCLKEDGLEIPSTILDECRIDTSWLSRRPPTLSDGEIQRVVLARMMALRYSAAVLDECTAALDPLTQASLWHAITTWSDRDGVTMLVISHDLNLLRIVTHRQSSFADLMNEEMPPPMR